MARSKKLGPAVTGALTIVMILAVPVGSDPNKVLIRGHSQNPRAAVVDQMGVPAPSKSEYFGEKPFTDHNNITRLLGLLDLTLRGLQPVVTAWAKGNLQVAGQQLLVYFRRRVRSWRLVKQTVKWMKSEQIADDALANRLTYLGGASPRRNVSFGSTGIDWQHNRFWESEHDQEWYWALHRHPFWLSMAWAYRMTADEKYPLGWREQLLDWIEKNPRDPRYNYDWGKRFRIGLDGKVAYENKKKVWPNPVSPHLSWAWRRIDAGRRALQFPELIQTFIESPHFTPKVLIHVLHSIHEHGEFLANEPYRGFTRDNHGLYEAEGSACLGIILREFKDAKVWRKNSVALLHRELKKQVRPDGIQLENVMVYQLATLRIFTDTAMLALHNRIKGFPDSYWAVIKQMVRAIDFLSFPDGRVPHIGDQGSKVNVDKKVKDWFAHFGMDQAAIRAITPPTTAMRWSGFFSIRSNWTQNATMLLLRCGPSYNAHSHKDAGSVLLYGAGTHLLPDSGCFSYNGIKEAFPNNTDRAYFQSTRAHSTLTYKMQDAHIPSLLAGPFARYKGYDDCGVLLWEPATAEDSGDAKLVIENRHTYREPDLSHRRAVLAAGPDAFVVIDEAIGEADGLVQSFFHMAPTRFTLGYDRMSAWSTRKEGGNLLIHGVQTPGTTMHAEKNWMSIEIGEKFKRPSIYFERHKETNEPAQFTTVLAVFRGDKPPSVDLTVHSDPGATNVSVTVSIGGGVARQLQYQFDPSRMEMAPPPDEGQLFEPEALYETYYDNFRNNVQNKVTKAPTAIRFCGLLSNDRSHPKGEEQCQPRIRISELETNPRAAVVVSPTRGYLYCGIPKCGVSRWRRLTRRIEGVPNWADNNAHNFSGSPRINGITTLADYEPTAAHRLINDPRYFSFVIVRSPYTRVLSGWLDKRDFPKFKLPQTFEAFLRDYLLPRFKTGKLNEHFQPMTSFCGLNSGMKFDLIARIEDMHVWGPRLVKQLGLTNYTASEWKGGFFRTSNDGVRHNHQTETKLTEHYTPDLMKLVEELYADDFAAFGYQTGVLMTGTPTP